jgi:hypothetical protein
MVHPQIAGPTSITPLSILRKPPEICAIRTMSPSTKWAIPETIAGAIALWSKAGAGSHEWLGSDAAAWL